MGRHHTKTDIIVEVVDVVVVAVGATGVPLIVVEGTTPFGDASRPRSTRRLIGQPCHATATYTLYTSKDFGSLLYDSPSKRLSKRLPKSGCKILKIPAFGGRIDSATC